MKKIFLFLALFFLCLPLEHSRAQANPENLSGFHPHQVVLGDSLYRLYGKDLNPELMKLIMNVNRIDPEHLVIGRTILLPDDIHNLPYYCPVPTRMETARGEKRKVYVFLDIQYFAVYEYGRLVFWGPISTADGKANPKNGNIHTTHLGIFHVLLKDSKHKSNDPECLGAPMPYAVKLTESGMFMHQQSLPGRPGSHGCIRLLMQDAMQLYHWIHLGDSVEITKTTENFVGRYLSPTS